MSETPTVDVRHLRVGLYVYLDLRWFDHPFPLGHFKIKSMDQIQTIQGLGLERVRYSPDLSDPPAIGEAERPKTQPAPQNCRIYASDLAFAAARLYNEVVRFPKILFL